MVLFLYYKKAVGTKKRAKDLHDYLKKRQLGRYYQLRLPEIISKTQISRLPLNKFNWLDTKNRNPCSVGI